MKCVKVFSTGTIHRVSNNAAAVLVQNGLGVYTNKSAYKDAQRAVDG